MVSVTNTLLNRFTNKLQNNSYQFKALMDEAKSGVTKDGSVVNKIFSNRLSNDVEANRIVLRNIGTGQAITNLAKHTLDDVADNLRSIQLLIQGADLADKTSLQLMQKDYINQVGDVLKTLNSTEFNGTKLFDGSFANREGARDNEAIPVSASPLSISLDDKINNNFKISIPRLLAGDGSAEDIEVLDRFTPLFPWNPASFTSIKTIEDTLSKAITIATAQPAVLQILTDKKTSDAVNAAFYQGLIDDINNGGGTTLPGLANNINQATINQAATEYLQEKIKAAMPEGSNAYVKAIFDTAKAVLALGPIADVDRLKAFIIQTANDSDATLTLDTQQAVQNIDNILTKEVSRSLVEYNKSVMVDSSPAGAQAAGSKRLKDLEDTIKGLVIPNDLSPAVRAIYVVVKTAGDSTLITTYPSLNRMKNTALAAAKAATAANPGLAAGDILTPENRETARKLIDQALTKVSTVTASLSSAQNVFTQATDNIQTINIQSSDAVSNISSANYVKNNAETLTIMRSNKIANVVFAMSEQALNKIIANLAAAATSS